MVALSLPGDRRQIDWGFASRPFPGEPVSGDLHVCVELADAIVLAVIDGLGHGSGAAEVARIAAATVKGRASEPLSQIMRECHTALRRSRGVVLTVTRIGHDGTLTWLGVGNVSGILWRRSERGFALSSRAPLGRGVLGSHVPALREERIRLQDDDLVVLCSDGIADPELWLPTLGSAAGTAEAILEHARENDDALVLVARYAGP